MCTRNSSTGTCSLCVLSTCTAACRTSWLLLRNAWSSTSTGNCAPCISSDCAIVAALSSSHDCRDRRASCKSERGAEVPFATNAFKTWTTLSLRANTPGSPHCSISSITSAGIRAACASNALNAATHTSASCSSPRTSRTPLSTQLLLVLHTLAGSLPLHDVGTCLHLVDL